MRHITFPIGDEERDQWMLCMKQAMQDVIEDKALREELAAAFFKTADFMKNKENK
jgi:hemoglobin